jgi:hypothetical protein
MSMDTVSTYSILYSGSHGSPHVTLLVGSSRNHKLLLSVALSRTYARGPSDARTTGYAGLSYSYVNMHEKAEMSTTEFSWYGADYSVSESILWGMA